MPTPLSIQFTPGYTWTVGETVTEDKLNLAANPTIDLIGTISSTAIADLAVTTAKLADGAVTTIKIADNNVTAVKLDQSTQGDVQQYAAGTYAAGVYAVTLSPARTGAYVAGEVIRFKADTANTATGAVDVNVNARGAKNLFKNVTTELDAGDIPINSVVTAVYDGTNFQVLAIAGVTSQLYTGTAAATLAAGSQTFAHGLVTTPRIVRAVLICTTAQAPYALNDELDVDGAFNTGGSNPEISYHANITNIVVTLYSTSIRVVSASGTYLNLTAGSWKVKVYAEK